MRRILTVARHEVRGYFDQPTAYVLAVAFLGISLFLGFRNMYASNLASMRPMFDLLPILFAVFVPAATMRTLAEERRGGTLEWLMAQPLSETEVIAGKFLGNCIFVLITLAGTVPTAVGMLMSSEADPGIVTAQYIGAALLASQLVALGVWASSMTRNQITAFIVAASLSFVLFLIGLPVVQIGLPPALSGALARLSVVSHFENVARGVVDLRDVLYFVSTTALFLVLAIGAVSRERLSEIRPEFKRLRLGMGVFVVLVLMANLLGSYVRGRLDLTAENLYTLSEGTEDLLGEIDDVVQIKLYASAELPPEIQIQLRDVRDLLADMRVASSGSIVVSELNPDDDEDAANEASAFGVFPIEFNVLRDDEFQIRRGYYGLALTYANDQEVMPLIERTDDLEFRLASAIYRMTTEARPQVNFVQGFETKGIDDIPGLRESLGDRYEIGSVDIAGETGSMISAESTEVLVVAGATVPLDSIAIQRVEEYINQGGATLLLMESIALNPQMPNPLPVRSGLESILSDRGVEFSGSLVADLQSSENVSMGRRGLFNVIAPYPLWPIAIPASDHPITSGINAVTFAWAAQLEITDTARVIPLWETTPSGIVRAPMESISPDQEWGVTPEELGVRTLAAALTPDEEETQGRVVVVGDATFSEIQFLQGNPSNLIFLANTIDWLAQDESLIRIRSQDRTPPTFVFSSEYGKVMLKWMNLIGIPILFVLVGVYRVTGRRRRAESRWKGVVA